MKFVCDKCNTRYSIADERVHGRVLKIRCKACNNVITVREEHAPAPAAPAAASSLEDALSNFQQRDDEQTRVSSMPPINDGSGVDDWYVSFDGDQEGPLPLARALDRVRAERPRGKECYCWRAGFFVWLPIEEVPEFAPALLKLPPPIPAVRPRPGTGQQPAVRSPTGKQAAVRSPTGSQQAVKSPTGSQQAIKSPTGKQPALRGPSGNMNVAKPASDLPPMDSGPLGTPAALLPSLETKPEPRLLRRDEPAPLAPAPLAPLSSSLPDSGPSSLSPFAAALKSTAPHDDAHVKPPTLDSGPVPLPPPPGEDLPIDEPSGMVNLSHVSRPTLAHPMSTAKPSPVMETFGGVAVTPSKPTPAPQPIIVSPGRAGAPGWIKWAALAGASATVALLIVVVVLMQRKPTVIVVPPAPTIDDGKKVKDKPITVEDSAPPQQASNTAQPATTPNPADAKRSQKRPPSSARAGTTLKPQGDNLSASQRNLAALYGDNGSEHAAHAAPTASDAHGGGSQVSQQAIMAVVTQNRRSLNLCYDRVLKHDSSLKSGRVVTHVRIGISGSVTGVSVPDPQYANSEIGQCIAQTIKHWHFPSADSEYETEFPIILQAN